MIAGTVKSRLITWICALTSICMLTAMALLLTQAYKLEITRAYSRIEDAARDAADEVEYDIFGRLSIDDDIVYYRDEVTVIIIDDTLDIVSGRLPAQFVNDMPIVKGKMRFIGNWIVFDLESDEPSLIIRAIYSLSDITENINRLLMTALAVFAGFICVLASVSFLIAKRAFAPLYTINDILNSVKPGREGKRIVLKNAAAEFNELAENVNKMLSRVETSFEMERRFTSDVSHELRTPLGIMTTNVEYAMAYPDDIKVSKSAIEECHSQLERMVLLVNSLLLIARADSGRITINRENVNLSELCLLAFEQQREIAQKHNIRLDSDIQPGIFIIGDETMLLVVLTNLLDNAIKYHRESGDDRFVSLSLKNDSGRRLICVTDNGRGIPKDHIEAVWERFHRVDTAKDSKQGTGLGLAIVRNLVAAHDGQCGATSEPGGLTRFWVRI